MKFILYNCSHRLAANAFYIHGDARTRLRMFGISHRYPKLKKKNDIMIKLFML